jgi:hypothetical protein
MRREIWLRNHHGWMKIPYRDGKHHVRKGKGHSYLELLDSRWGVEEGDLGNGLGDCLPNQDFPLEGGESGISGAAGFSGNSRGNSSSTGGNLMWGEASMGGILYPLFFKLEYTTHTCVEGCRWVALHDIPPVRRGI